MSTLFTICVFKSPTINIRTFDKLNPFKRFESIKGNYSYLEHNAMNFVSQNALDDIIYYISEQTTSNKFLDLFVNIFESTKKKIQENKDKEDDEFDEFGIVLLSSEAHNIVVGLEQLKILDMSNEFISHVYLTIGILKCMLEQIISGGFIVFKN
jgi:hypothetical protein